MAWTKTKTTEPRRCRFRYGLTTIFVVTTVFATAFAYLENARKQFNDETKSLEELYVSLNRSFPNLEKADDPYGIRALFTTVAYREWTHLGKLTGIPFLKRVKTISLQAKECTPNVWAILEDFDALKTLIVRGDVAGNELNAFRNARTDVEVINIPD